MRYFLFAGVWAAMALAAPALAQDIDCRNPMAQNTMNICADRDFQRADRMLNGVYANLLSVLGDRDFRDKLRAAQRNWLSYRDNECRFETAENEGGSIHPMVYAGCLTRLTKERIRALEAITTCTKNPENCGR